MDIQPVSILAVGVAGALALFAAWGIITEVPDMAAGCYGRTPGSMSSDDACAGRGVSSESVGEAVARMVLVQGSVLAAAAFTVVGVVRSDGRWFGAAGVLSGVVSVPLLFGIYWLVTGVAMLACFAAAYMEWPRQRQVPA